MEAPEQQEQSKIYLAIFDPAISMQLHEADGGKAFLTYLTSEHEYWQLSQPIQTETPTQQLQVIDCEQILSQAQQNNAPIIDQKDDTPEEGECDFSLVQEQSYFRTENAVPQNEFQSQRNPVPEVEICSDEVQFVTIIEEQQEECAKAANEQIVLEETSQPGLIIIEESVEILPEEPKEAVQVEEKPEIQVLELVEAVVPINEAVTTQCQEESKQIEENEKEAVVVEESSQAQTLNNPIREQEHQPNVQNPEPLNQPIIQSEQITTHQTITQQHEPQQPNTQQSQQIPQPIPNNEQLQASQQVQPQVQVQDQLQVQVQAQPQPELAEQQVEVPEPEPVEQIPQYEENVVHDEVVEVLQTVINHMRIITKLVAVNSEHNQIQNEIIFQIEPLLPIQSLLEASDAENNQSKQNKPPQAPKSNPQKTVSDFKASLAQNQVSQELLKDRCVLFAKFTTQTLPKEFLVLFGSVEDLFEKVKFYQQSLYSMAEIQPQKQLILKIPIFMKIKNYRIQLQKLQISSEQFLERKNRQLLEEMEKLYKNFTLTREKCEQLKEQCRKLSHYSQKIKSKQQSNSSESHTSNQQIAKSIKFAMEVVKSVNKRTNAERDTGDGNLLSADEETRIVQNGEEMSISERNLRKKIKKSLQETLSSSSHSNTVRK